MLLRVFRSILHILQREIQKINIAEVYFSGYSTQFKQELMKEERDRHMLSRLSVGILFYGIYSMDFPKTLKLYEKGQGNK